MSQSVSPNYTYIPTLRIEEEKNNVVQPVGSLITCKKGIDLITLLVESGFGSFLSPKF